MSLRNPDPRQKPPPGSYIDWSHPLAEGLTTCILINEQSGVVQDLTGNAYEDGFCTWIGGHLNFDGSNNFIRLARRKNPDWPNHTSNSASFFSIARPSNPGSRAESIWNTGELADINAAMGMAIWSDGSLTFDCNSQFTNSAAQEYSEAIVAPKVASFGISHLNLSNRLYMYDGQMYPPATQVDIFSYNIVATNPYFIGWAYANTNGQNKFTGEIHCVYSWDKALSETHLLFLHEAPYSFIIWPQTLTYFDLGAGTVGYTGNITDTFLFLDNTIPKASYSTHAVDSINLSSADNGVGAYIKSLLDQIGITSVQSSLGTYKIQFTDNINFNDIVNISVSYKAKQSDTINFSYSLVATLKAIGLISELINLAEQVSYQSSTATGAVTEQLSLNDNLTALAQLISSIVESLSLDTDEQTKIAYISNLVDNFAFDDEATTQIIGYIIETLSLIDDPKCLADFIVNILDSFSIGDNASGNIHLQIVLTESINLNVKLGALLHITTNLIETFNLNSLVRDITVSIQGKVTITFKGAIPTIIISGTTPTINFSGE